MVVLEYSYPLLVVKERKKTEQLFHQLWDLKAEKKTEKQKGAGKGVRYQQ